MATTLTLGDGARDRQYLFGPFLDFLLLGGASLLVLPVVALLPVDDFEPKVFAVMLVLANFINHPHFANSYQVFYRNFRAKITHGDYAASLRWRYGFAGIFVPLSLVALFLAAFEKSDPLLLGRAANVMVFLVGWHYVKQGYGILMLDAVLKRSFFNPAEKKALMLNAYVCWLATWAYGNRYVEARDYLNLRYHTFAIPEPLFHAAALLAATTTALVMVIFIARLWRRSTVEPKGIPFNGVIAYLTSIYLWMMFVRINPLFIAIVPAFHSLQYLAVIWRYQSGVEAAGKDAKESPETMPFGSWFDSRASYRLAIFLLVGLSLGYLGFWRMPNLFDDVIPYDQATFGGTAFLFMFWIFINVHHYFIDNVIWKKGNPDVAKHLFAPSR